jgi:hypothetical protein
MRCLISALLTAMLLSQSALPQSAQQASLKELLQIENLLLNAYVHRDLSVRDRYVAADFTGVDNEGNVYTKEQDMHELRDGVFAMKSFKLEGVQVRLLGDTAIVTGRNTTTTVYKGKEETSAIRFADTFHNHNGQWQMVYSQDTGVAPATPEASQGKEQEKGDDLTAYASNSEICHEDGQTVEQQIICLEKRLSNANASEILGLESEDMETIKHLHRYHREDDVAATMGFKIRHWIMDDVRVRMLKPDVGLITDHVNQSGTFNGIELPPSIYLSSIWVKQNGGWKNVFLAETGRDVFTDIYKPISDESNSVHEGSSAVRH